ncbi:MAG: spore coat polysaccharide biosynthesis predicted glycosyltransferase SpsG [Chlamydiales bacterium]|jgi:spore coat polysaccharide biosynthesis predicted glycosyltransferase SpsG
MLRAAGGPAVGVGHLVRTRAIAQECIRRGLDFELIVDDGASADWLGARGTPAVPVEASLEWLQGQPRAIWIDGFRDWHTELSQIDRERTCTILVENRIADRDLASFTVYPALHHEPDAWDRTNAERVRSGAEWIPLSREAIDTPCCDQDIDLLVSFGGCDPAHLTERALTGLASMGFAGHVVTVVGPHMADRYADIVEAGRGLAQHEVLDGSAGIAGLQARARFALTALGTTLYELAWFGVPALIIANYEDDRPALDWYAANGIHLPLGVASQLSDRTLEQELRAGLLELERRPKAARMDLAGGSRRIVDLLTTEPAHA